MKGALPEAFVHPSFVNSGFELLPDFAWVFTRFAYPERKFRKSENQALVELQTTI